MEFVFADSLGIESKIVVLRRDTQPFLIHFYQHTGNFFGAAARIGNENDADATVQFRYFLTAIRQCNFDLVLLPCLLKCSTRSILRQRLPASTTCTILRDKNIIYLFTAFPQQPGDSHLYK